MTKKTKTMWMWGGGIAVVAVVLGAVFYMWPSGGKKD